LEAWLAALQQWQEVPFGQPINCADSNYITFLFVQAWLTSIETDQLYKLLLILLVGLSMQPEAQKTTTSKELSLYFDQPDVLKKAGIKNVRCIFKDSRKLIWLGTENGIFRYDGTNIIYKRHKPGDTTSIPNNTIASITEDQQGNIWLGTIGGIACMNPYSFKCKVYADELHNLPKGNFDNKVFVDPSGEIWAGNSEGLFLLDKKESKFKRVWRNILPNKFISGYVTSLLYWKKDTLLAGTFSGLVLINTKNFGFRRIAPLNKDILVGPLCLDAQHRLWIGTWGEGCIIADSTLAKFQQFKWEKDIPSGVDNIASSLSEVNSAGSHDMWIAGGWVLSKIPLFDRTQKVNLKNSLIYKIGQDKKNNDPDNIGVLLFDGNYIWTAGNSTVAKFSADKNLFQTLSIPIKGIVENIQPIELRGKKYLAISSWHGAQGIVFWNREKGTSKIIDSIVKGDPYGTNISGVAKDKYERLWLASLAGTYVLNENFQIVGNLLNSKNKADIPSSKKANDILINNDTVWIACYKNGIDLYDLNFHKLKHFSDNDSGLEDDLIERFFKDSRGNLWICGNGFFYKYLPATSRFKKYDFSIDHTVYSPYDMTELPDGHLVIATATAGLIYFDPSSERFDRITTSLLEKEEGISSVTCDAHGNIWYLTSSHLVEYQPASRKFTLFGEEDGLNIDGLQLIKCFDGREVFLAEGGKLLRFSPSDWQKKAAPPLLVLHAVQVNDSLMAAAGPLHQLHLNYNHNKIYFEFDGINYIKPEQNQYAYKLTGVDEGWIYTNKNSVSYANLSPGDYEFHVKAANYQGEWSKEYVVTIAIDPPYWKTWWFIGLSALALGALFVLIIRYISQRNLRERILKLEKEQAIEKERNRIARDMHDDLGSGLTKIAILSEVAKTQLKQKEAATVQLENISHSSRELVDSLQNIIWVLNPKNDSLENLSSYIREYALKFFDSTNAIVHFHYPQQIPPVKLSEEQRRNIFMVIKETLNNTAKHSCCSNVSIELLVHKKQLILEIKDDGKGFEACSIRPFANGLINMKQRMEQINGFYEIHSAKDKGTATRLTTPL
jgi:signal transduction histidine kinase/ligand-binding sensor domain-containing protein